MVRKRAREDEGDIAEVVHDHSREGGGALAILFKNTKRERN